MINAAPESGAGDLYQPENRLSPRKTVWFNTASGVTMYYLPVKATRIISVIVDGVVQPGTKWSYNSGTGMIRFSTAPPVTDPPTNNNVRITYELENADAYQTVDDCRYAEVYGGTGALCIVLAGSTAQPNLMIWNGQDSISMNPGYFPIEQYQLCGDADEDAVCSADDGKKYFLTAGSRTFVWDYELSTYSSPAWFLLTNTAAIAYITEDTDLWHLNAAGQLTVATDTLSDYGEGIDRVFRFATVNFGSYDTLKTVNSVIVTLGALAKSDTTLQYLTDYELRAGLTNLQVIPADEYKKDRVPGTRPIRDSPTYRSRVWSEWQSSLKSRLAAKGKVVLIMTRWHEEDFLAQLLETESPVQVLRLPIEAEENDPLGRAVGEALMKFRLEKHIPDSEGGPGGWYYEGTYSPASINRLCTCCFLLGGAASAYDNIRVTTVEGPVRVSLHQGVERFLSNSKTAAVTTNEIKHLAEEVKQHNNFARRMPVVEEQIKEITKRLEDLERRN